MHSSLGACRWMLPSVRCSSNASRSSNSAPEHPCDKGTYLARTAMSPVSSLAQLQCEQADLVLFERAERLHQRCPMLITTAFCGHRDLSGPPASLFQLFSTDLRFCRPCAQRSNCLPALTPALRPSFGSNILLTPSAIRHRTSSLAHASRQALTRLGIAGAGARGRTFQPHAVIYVSECLYHLSRQLVVVLQRARASGHDRCQLQR